MFYANLLSWDCSFCGIQDRISKIQYCIVDVFRDNRVPIGLLQVSNEEIRVNFFIVPNCFCNGFRLGCFYM